MVLREKLSKGMKIYKDGKEYTVSALCNNHIHLKDKGIVYNSMLHEYTLEKPYEIKDGVVEIKISGYYTFRMYGLLEGVTFEMKKI